MDKMSFVLCETLEECMQNAINNPPKIKGLSRMWRIRKRGQPVRYRLGIPKGVFIGYVVIEHPYQVVRFDIGEQVTNAERAVFETVNTALRANAARKELRKKRNAN